MTSSPFPGDHEVFVSAAILPRSTFCDKQLRDTILILTSDGVKFGYLVRRPIPTEFLSSVLRFGTGALAIDACRKPWANDEDRLAALPGSMPGENASIGTFETRDRSGERPEDFQSGLGRWPTNVVLVHHTECTEVCSPACIMRKLGPEATRYYPQFRSPGELITWLGTLVQANRSR